MHLFVGQQLVDINWCFQGSVPGRVRLGRECIVSSIEHLLGVVVRVGVGLDTEVTEHSIRFPTAKELDGVLVYACAEKSSGTTGAKAFRSEELRVDVVDVVSCTSTNAEGLSHVLGFGFVPLVAVVVEVPVQGCFGGVFVIDEVHHFPEVKTEAGNGLDWAYERVSSGSMAYLLSPDCILLVNKGE